MKGSLDEKLKNEIKALIIESCELDIGVEQINDDSPLFSAKSELGLDSIDALQISIAIQNTYGIAIRDSKQMRRVVRSVNTFADFLQPE